MLVLTVREFININTEKKLNKYTALNVIKLKLFIFSNAVKFIKADIFC